MKVIELFAGIGSPRKSLEKLNINHKVIAFSEIDKFAVDSYRAIYNDLSTPNLGDITKIKELPECDLLVYGSPCQDISRDGKKYGIKKGTRSGLLWEIGRLLDIYNLKKMLPKYIIFENVADILNINNRKEYEKWLLKLEDLGYKNYYKVLNSIDYGIPHSRKRLFCVSILDQNSAYNFPGKIKLKITMNDLLENEVSEKYFLKDNINNKYPKDKMIIDNRICKCIDANYGKGTNLKHFLSKGKRQLVQQEDFRIRMLTPLECWRLMGFEDQDYFKTKEVVRQEFQQYKLVGNSIAVPVMMAIFKNLFLEEEVGEYKLF